MGPSLPVLYLTSIVQCVQEIFVMSITPLYIEALHANTKTLKNKKKLE